MGDYKGKPGGTVARTKKDVGKQSDIKKIGAISGARKKKLNRNAGVVGVAGIKRQRKGHETATATR